LTQQIKRVGLLANPEKISCRPVVRQAARLIARAGRTMNADASTAQLAGLTASVAASSAALAQHSDLLLVFGGDGTMLRVAREVAGSPTPILGINVGGLGFLTAVPCAQLAPSLRQVWAGAFRLEARSLIEASGRGNGAPIAQLALNDFVISRGAASRMIELEVSVDDEVLTHYRCDGLIVSSPTGSTAYSLSAGGAVVSPAAEVLTLTPICPHTLSNRSVIVSFAAKVRVKILSEKLETILTADGQVQTELAAGDAVTICRSRRGIRLVRLAGSSFFETLRKKLNWSGSNV
jgi:NAD+ kinase